MLNKDYKPKVGDKLWLHATSTSYKHNEGIVEVCNVGKKYFYVKRGEYFELKFDLKSHLLSNGWNNYHYLIFHSKKDCEYYFETSRRRRCISDKLFLFLTDEEVNELYNELILRDK